MRWSVAVAVLSIVSVNVLHVSANVKAAEDKVETPVKEPVGFVNQSSEGGIHHKTYLLKSKGDFARVEPVTRDAYEELSVFCYTGVVPVLSLFWSSAGMKLDVSCLVFFFEYFYFLVRKSRFRTDKK